MQQKRLKLKLLKTPFKHGNELFFIELESIDCWSEPLVTSTQSNLIWTIYLSWSAKNVDTLETVANAN